MAKACIYCKTSIDQNSVVDVCRRCGIGVWGEKMFNAIVENMEGAKEKGDLYQGSVTDPHSQNSRQKPQTNALNSMAKEAVQNKEINTFEEKFEPDFNNSDEDKSTSVLVDGLY